MKKRVGWWSCAMLALLTGSAKAQLFQAPYGPGGTWNIYEFQAAGATWADAQAAARASTQQGKSGDLVSIGSSSENWSVQRMAGLSTSWIGLTDREGAAPGAFESEESADKHTNGWAWSSGDPFTYQNWNGGEPNNWDGAKEGTKTSGVEDAVALLGDSGLWNDEAIGFGTNLPVVPTIVPGSSGDESGGGTHPYVIEYKTASPTKFAGITEAPLPARLATFPLQRLDGPLGTAGNWGVVDYRFTDGSTVTAPGANVVDQILQIQSGDLAAESTTANFKWLDVTDPDTNANGGAVSTYGLGDGLYAYPSNQDGVDDDDIISVAHARVQVTEPGAYTFQVHSDDGFAFRIRGASFTNAQGNGRIDPESSDTLEHPANTGDSATMGVVTLAAGTYDMEFLSWERGGGAFYELTAAKGDLVNPANKSIIPRFAPVGDTSGGSDVVTKAIAKLTGPLTVSNLDTVNAQDLLTNLDDLRAGPVDETRNDVKTLMLDDHSVSSGGCPFGDVPSAHAYASQFPNNDGSDKNNFSTLVTGAFKVDDGDGTAGENLQISIHVDSDDRALFHIKGASFDATVNAMETDIDGDNAMFGDVDTCNTNQTGLITLKEGVTYNFEAVHVEAGGDAGLQVLAALGDYVNNPVDPKAFVPLSTEIDTLTWQGNALGLKLVAETAGLLGDYNSNGVLDAADLDLQAAALGGNNPAYDLTGDNAVNGDDRTKWLHDLKKTWVGDADLDGNFDSNDLVQVFVAGKYETGTSAGWADGDFDGDGTFGSGDLVAAFVDGGYEAGPLAAVSAVPEPASLTLFGLGGLLLLRRRK